MRAAPANKNVAPTTANKYIHNDIPNTDINNSVINHTLNKYTYANTHKINNKNNIVSNKQKWPQPAVTM